MLLFIHEENVWYLRETDKIKCVLSGYWYVIITARPLFRGCATPRGLSRLTDGGDNENEKQKVSILQVGAMCACAHNGHLKLSRSDQTVYMAVLTK